MSCSSCGNRSNKYFCVLCNKKFCKYCVISTTNKYTICKDCSISLVSDYDTSKNENQVIYPDE